MEQEAKLAVKPLSLTDIEVPETVRLQLPKEAAIQLLAEFQASGGLVVGEDGEPTKMSLKQFAYEIGWAERTIYNWIDNDPNWDARVFAAIKRVHGAKRVSRVLRGVFLKASAGESKAAELYLRNFYPDFKGPKAELSHDFKGFADIIAAAQQRNIIDAEPVGTNALSQRSDEDTATHPG